MPRNAKAQRGGRRYDRDAHITRMRETHSRTAQAKVDKQATDIAATMKDMQKRFGAGVFMSIAGQRAVDGLATIPTGWQEFDDILTGETDSAGRSVYGTGIGWPRGRIVEIFGPENSGKTTLCLHAIAQAQRRGIACAFIDAEHSLDTKYAAHLGVDLTSLKLAQPDSAEQAFEIVRELARSKLFGIIVVDSIAAMEPEVEQKKKMSDSIVAAQARLVSSALRRLIGITAKSNVLLLFTNQLRMKIGVMFGNPETTPGGKALKFYASIRLDVRKIKQIMKSGRVIGHRARIKAVKNKAAPPYREIYADIYPNVGIATVHGDPDFGEEDATALESPRKSKRRKR